MRHLSKYDVKPGMNVRVVRDMSNCRGHIINEGVVVWIDPVDDYICIDQYYPGMKNNREVDIHPSVVQPHVDIYEV